jgi:hypothetical protein
MVRRWQIEPGELGFILSVSDAETGEVQRVKPHTEGGDPLAMVRDFCVTYGRVGDLIVEPDRVYQIQPPILGA